MNGDIFTFDTEKLKTNLVLLIGGILLITPGLLIKLAWGEQLNIGDDFGNTILYSGMFSLLLFIAFALALLGNLAFYGLYLYFRHPSALVKFQSHFSIRLLLIEVFTMTFLTTAYAVFDPPPAALLPTDLREAFAYVGGLSLFVSAFLVGALHMHELGGKEYLGAYATLLYAGIAGVGILWYIYIYR